MRFNQRSDRVSERAIDVLVKAWLTRKLCTERPRIAPQKKSQSRLQSLLNIEYALQPHTVTLVEGRTYETEAFEHSFNPKH